MRILVVAWLLVVAGCVPAALADENAMTAEEDAKVADNTKSAEGIKIFQDHVRLILAHKCVMCHGGDLAESDFDLTTREGLLRGGRSGAAIVPGDPAASRMYKLVTRQQTPYMPDEGERLTEQEVAHLARWIEWGAPYDKPLLDRAAAAQPWTERKISDDAREFWSFQPLRIVEPPAIAGDAWGRTPLDRYVLAALRERGLEPNPVADKRTLIRRAYLDLIGLPPTPEEVDAFLADDSPEAWPRLIDRLLDSPHYGERWARHWLDVARFAESHGFEQDYDRPHAYHFRDFVIRALNDDMPYDQFVRWQLAGDELAPDEPLALMATGFLGAGVFPTQITANEVERTRYDALDDMAATTGTAMLGLTIGCARCHDHKFDPIPQADYYRFLATFTTTVRSNVELRIPPDAAPVKVMICSEGVTPIRHHTQGGDFFNETHFLRRGNCDQKETVASQGFLQVLMTAPDKEQHWQVAPPEGWRTSYRRTALANWIVDTKYGAGHLLARVIVNRLWQHHLGRGIVATPNDFGMQGARPTHPELLDYAASELIAGGWRLKPLHRAIMTSAVYMQSADWDAGRAAIDPDNFWCWRRSPRRLEAEAIRDSMLAASGLIDRRMFGPGTLDEGHQRRSIYFMVKRSRLIPTMLILDSPEPLVSVGDRPTTTIAPQALLILNNPHVRSYAKGFAARLQPVAEQSLVDAVALGYRIALGREPDEEERADAVAFVESQHESYRADGKPNPRELALADFCHVLFGLNEFVYVE